MVKDYEGFGFWTTPDDANIAPPEKGEVALFVNGNILDGYAVREKSGEIRFHDDYSDRGDILRAMDRELVFRALGKGKEASEYRKKWISEILNEVENITWDRVPEDLLPGLRWLARNRYVTGPRTVRETDSLSGKEFFSVGVFLTEKGIKFLGGEK